MFKSVAFKMFLRVGIIIMIFGATIASSSQFLLRFFYMRSAMAKLNTAAEEIVDKLNSKGFLDNDAPFHYDIYTSVALSNNVQILIYKNGVAEYNSHGGVFGELTNSESLGKNKQGEFFDKFEPDSGARFLCFERSVDATTKIEARTELDPINSNFQVTKVFVWIIVLAGGALALILAYVHAYSYARPLREMNKTTSEFAALNFESKCEVTGCDEVGNLAAGINILGDKLCQTITELQDKNQQLREELERQREFDERLKNLVSDVSHELKTPLSIIQGYTEALEGVTTEEKRREYGAIITEETVRMNRLVGDILKLSHYTGSSYEPQKQNFDIDILINGILIKHENIVKSKGVKLKKKIEKANVFADRERIEQVIHNYFTNALSHADEKGIISVTGSVLEDGRYKVVVFNSGEHIVEENIEKIWRPFYRADKARSRSEGRFGIGLSIVASILDNHHAEYGAVNVDGGVEFFFVI